MLNNNYYKKGMALAMVLGAVSTTAIAKMPTLPLHLGLTASGAATKPESDYGKILPNNFYYRGVVLGARVHKYLGLEIGYRASTTRERNVFMGSTTTFFDPTITLDTNTNSNAQVKKKVIDFDVNGFFPINRYWDVAATVGLGRAKLTTDMTVDQIAGSVDEQLRQIDDPSGTNLHASAGIDFKFQCKWRIAVRALWESNKKLTDHWDIDNTDKRLYKDEIGASIALTFSPFTIW